MAELTCLLDRDPDGVDATHLARADADRLSAAREHDRVRRDVLAHAPRKEDVVPRLVGNLAAGYAHRCALLRIGVAVLDEQTAEDTAEVALARRVLAPFAVLQD